MEYSAIYVRRIRQLCRERGLSINGLATMSGVKQIGRASCRERV